jgi:hypothetical protein
VLILANAFNSIGELNMKKSVLAAGVLAAVTIASPAFAMTDAECAASWTSADTDKDGTVTEAESGRHFAALRVANKPVADGKLSNAAFLAHCKAGTFNTVKTDAGAPLSGSTSFTEGQAKDRAMAAGFTSVSALKKDQNGVWRGAASQGTKGVNVAIDFKGNVVAN